MIEWDKIEQQRVKKRRNRIRGKEWKRLIERNKKILKEREGGGESAGEKKESGKKVQKV